MANWSIDTMHSEVQFKVKHLVISTVTGSFKSFLGNMEASQADMSDAKVTFTADVDSIDTNNSQRDTHLKSDDFFNAEKYPKIHFHSSKITKTAGKSYTLTGDITIREVTKTIELAVVYGGTAIDGYGQTKTGFEIKGKINRKDFGLTWSALTEAGGLIVGDDIILDLNIQVTKQS